MRNKLISSLAGAAFSFAGSGLAVAADMPVKAPLPAPAPANTWAGWYVGGNAGYGWGTSDEIQNLVTPFCNSAIATPCPALGSAFQTAAPGSFNAKPRGFIGGGQIGYNWQNATSVYGWVADFQGGDIKGSQSIPSAAEVAGTVPTATMNVSGTGSQKLDWLGTVRGRIGLTLWPSALLYATAGFAYGETKSNVTFSESVSNCTGCGPFPTDASSLSRTRAGWVVGYGTEWMFAPHWSLSSETLYYDLGSANLNTAVFQTDTVGTPAFGGTIQTTVHYNGFISRAGLNYYF